MYYTRFRTSNNEQEIDYRNFNKSKLAWTGYIQPEVWYRIWLERDGESAEHTGSIEGEGGRTRVQRFWAFLTKWSLLGRKWTQNWIIRQIFEKKLLVFLSRSVLRIMKKS